LTGFAFEKFLSASCFSLVIPAVFNDRWDDDKSGSLQALSVIAC
jgi:hypothetical protein